MYPRRVIFSYDQYDDMCMYTWNFRDYYVYGTAFSAPCVFEGQQNGIILQTRQGSKQGDWG